MRQTYYTGVIDAPAVVNEENFRVWGASTTPTLALVDRNGIVRMYHPGALAYAELRGAIRAALYVRGTGRSFFVVVLFQPSL